MTTWRILDRGTLSRDLVLASATFLGGLLMLALDAYRPLNPGLLPAPPVVFVGTLAVACTAVALRRVATRTGLVLGTVAFLVDLASGFSLATALVYTQVLYDSCVYGPPRLWRLLLRISLALTGVAALLGVVLVTPPSWQGVALAVPVVLVGVLPVVTGISVRQYRDQAAAERARAEQTARLAELDRRQAVAAERSRMARELHDVVANHLSAVAIHATAALSIPNLDRGQVEQALRVIRENSVQGLNEMRRMISLLREPAEVTAEADGVPPGLDGAEGPLRVRLAEVDRLIAQARAAGLAVRFETVGEARPLPVGVDLAAYRVVQESLTNALKHGAGSATVTVDYRPGSLRLTITNPLPGPDAEEAGNPARPSAGAGLPGARAGLIGMRERVTLLHGRFTAGPCGSGWRVRAEFPTEAETTWSGTAERGTAEHATAEHDSAAPATAGWEPSEPGEPETGEREVEPETAPAGPAAEDGPEPGPGTSRPGAPARAA
ncbi:sensor histidine kinase [Micromonospora sp. HM5-17]|uniref:sensor histidine kinase n=1 Tax=Micromonospora sp. HM5-17 TaxID=2487710 RepID=UPI0018F343FA|nr:histidine kinase [Micromonospora sp. HM5-17]